MARICIIRQLYFPLDTRVRREVHALLDAGHEVDVVCLSRPGEPRREVDGLLTVYRLPLRHRRGGVRTYLAEYMLFLLVATLLTATLHLFRRYQLVQVNTVPDTLVFAALIPRLLGTPVLLDLHECMPEFYATKYGCSLDHPIVRLLGRLEQASIRFASFAMTCTEHMREAFVARGARRRNIEIVLNSADEAVFDVNRHPPKGRRPGRFVLVSHGSIEERYGLDTVVRAVALLTDQIPELRLDVYGEGSHRDNSVRLVRELGVEDRVRFSDGFVPLEELVRGISEADGGVVAMKRDAFRDLTHTNKMFDLIAMRRPALVSRTHSVEAYFDEESFGFFRDSDERDLARVIRRLHDEPGWGDRLVEHAATVAEPYRWPHQREIYLALVDELMQGGRPAATPATPRGTS
jgi:glycosyltransferase involved in cell wall biosynthesis